MSDDETTIEITGLDQILKALKSSNPPQARVGILGNNSRSGGGSSNAEIGAVHEFGAPGKGIVARSFLRVPIAEHLQKKLDEAGLLSEDNFKEVVRTGSVRPFLLTVAAVGEGIVAEAFATSGFGRWAPWRNEGYSNGGGQLLIDTGQLQGSITSEVTEGG